MPPSCADFRSVAPVAGPMVNHHRPRSPRAGGSSPWVFSPVPEGEQALDEQLDPRDAPQELCVCTKDLDDGLVPLNDDDEVESFCRLRALSIHEQTCSICQRSQRYYRAVQRRRSLSTCDLDLDMDWESQYRSSGWWMIGVVVALLASVCAFVSPSELGASLSLSMLNAKPSLFDYMPFHAGEPVIHAEYPAHKHPIRELLHRAHVVIHSAARGKVVVEHDAVAARVAEFSETERVMDIYCRGPLLHAVQMLELFSDCKHFVDMPIKANSSSFDVLVDFQRRKLALTEFVPSHHEVTHESALRSFLDDHFDSPGTDLLPITPFDYIESALPPRLAEIRDPELQQWALSLHHLWRSLGRVPSPQVKGSYLLAPPLEHEQLARSQNVLIVPGGRFRESYYWDSYWIVHGLLASDMHVTARGVVTNLLEYVAEFGFVPNGGRVYYLTRSQPPMLSEMVKIVAENATKSGGYDVDYIDATLPILEREYAFWMQQGPDGHAVELEWRNGNDTTTRYVLNRYTSGANMPRPESYREDVLIASEMFDEVVKGTESDASTVQQRKDQYYNDVIAATESGWDFSSRWLQEPHDMKTMVTSNVLPADLNAILFRMERNLGQFHYLTGNTTRAKYFTGAARARQDAMDRVLWNDEAKSWRDFDLTTRSHSSIVSVSDYAPLWAGAFDSNDTQRISDIVGSLRASGLVQVGGIQATTTFSGQQWDAPNAWSPNQDMVVEGLLIANTSESNDMAKEVAQTWVRAGLAAFQRTGLMFEKYNSTEVGGLGVGGEYFPQFGFGWTNGVVLKFLTLYQGLL